MPQKQTLATIWQVTDDDTGMYHIGEVDGGFNAEPLLCHIADHGTGEILKMLARMTAQVINIERELQDKESAGMQAQESINKPIP